MKSHKVRILIVDDNDDLRLLLQSCLEHDGYQVTTASDGSEALEVLKHIRPDLIVMDLNMPVTDGITAARHIREQEDLSQIPIVFVTGHGVLGIELYQNLSILEGGQIEYLPKPVDLQLFKDLITRLIPESGQPQVAG